VAKAVKATTVTKGKTGSHINVLPTLEAEERYPAVKQSLSAAAGIHVVHRMRETETENLEEGEAQQRPLVNMSRL
jgi:hypothetical protein